MSAPEQPVNSQQREWVTYNPLSATYETPDGTSVPAEMVESVQCLGDVMNIAMRRFEQRQAMAQRSRQAGHNSARGNTMTGKVNENPDGGPLLGLGLGEGLGMRNKRQWLRGYYCAVAVLLREAGNVTAEVRSLYEQGGDASQADPHDLELFAHHGLHA